MKERKAKNAKSEEFRKGKERKDKTKRGSKERKRENMLILADPRN